MQEQQPEEEKTIDSTSALQKAIRLDKKHTNFDYNDPFRGLTLKIAYPQLQPQGPSSETLLKSLWRHVCNYYFKTIEDNELRRLHYLKNIITANTEGTYRFEESEQFWETIEALYSNDFLRKYLKGGNEKIELQNTLETLHVIWQISKAGREQTNSKAHHKHRISWNIQQQLNTDIARIYASSDSYQQKLTTQSRRIRQSIIKPNQTTQIDHEIHRLERELQETMNSVKPIYNKLEQRVAQEAQLQDIIYCQPSGAYSVLPQPPSSNVQSSGISRKLMKLGSFEILSKYIEYTIRQLQKRQIAESVTKILRLEKHKGETRFVLAFEQAMDLKPITISQQEFHEINDLREYSLLKFYNTASKSLYSFVCQNYIGFKNIFNDRHRPCTLKEKSILDQMKRHPSDSANSAYQKQFSRLEICHHCKLLHPESALVRCDYRSSRVGNPVPPSPYYDSYVYQIMRSHHGCYPDQQSRITALRFLNNIQSRKNSYFHYIKDNDEYVCERRYCRYCLKNYEEGRDKSGGLCPYCRGICYCTRCTRNQTMIRLKSLYILLGGDINHLQKNSIFEKYYNQSEEAVNLRRKDNHKHVKRNSSAPGRMNDKMLSIRFQLEDLSIICDLVKRREKNKQKLKGCMRDVFRKKIQMIDPNFRMGGSLPKRELAHTTDLNEKLQKKLRRMIS